MKPSSKSGRTSAHVQGSAKSHHTKNLSQGTNTADTQKPQSSKSQSKGDVVHQVIYNQGYVLINNPNSSYVQNMGQNFVQTVKPGSSRVSQNSTQISGVKPTHMKTRSTQIQSDKQSQKKLQAQGGGGVKLFNPQ